MRLMIFRRRAAFAVFLIAAGCSDGDPGAADMSSFDQVQAIFDAQCVSCHTAGNQFATESGLVLTKDLSYAQLVNAPSKNTAARADALLRVTPNSADRSLLYHKLHWNADHHQSRNYGAPMPLGGQTLTAGEIEFIRRWIEAGAPRDGAVVDVKVLDDKSRPSAGTFTPLARPSNGYQLRIEPFAVRPNFERELFVYRRVGNAQEIFVNRIETSMRPNSHHFLIYTFGNIPSALVPPVDVVRDIRNPDGSMNLLNMLAMGYHVFFAGSMTPTSDYRFPDGVALRLPANAGLDLNSHYVNKTDREITGEAYANLHTVDRAQVQHVARTLNLPNLNFSLAPRQRTTITTTFLAGSAELPVGADGTVRILMLTSHMHARGERFVIRIAGGARNGEIIYSTTDWAHPGIITFTPPLVLQRGEGLTSEVTYNNTTDRTIGFGLTSEDEMNIIFGYAY